MRPDGGSGSTGDTFLDRKANLCTELNLIEKSLNKHKNHKNSYVPRLEELSIRSPSRRKIKGFRGNESIFKRPEGPAPKRYIQPIPDYQRHPEKWTFYSLEDVPELTNAANTQIAISVCNELKKQRIKESKKQYRIKNKSDKDTMDIDASVSMEDMEVEERFIPDDDNENKIVFHKPQNEEKPINDKPKPEFKNSKLKMPEYDFGTKRVSKQKQTRKSTRSEKICKDKEIKLGHLLTSDEDEMQI